MVAGSKIRGSGRVVGNPYLIALRQSCPASGRRRQRASKSGLSMFGLLDYRGWPRRRLHSPRAERMKVKPPSPPSAQSVQTKDRKSTRLNSSHGYISYAVFCLKKKNKLRHWIIIHASTCLTDT